MNASSTLPKTAANGVVSSLRSAGAVFAGLFAGAVLSVGTDEVLHLLLVYPPWGEPMDALGLNLLALAYRCFFDTFGLYLVARLAPRNPIRHLWIAAGVGFALATLGVLGSLNANLGPVWYPVALALSTFPCAWGAARLYEKRVLARG